MSPPRWLPNLISVIRVLLVPVWVVVAEVHQAAFALDPSVTQGRWLALAILVTIGVSDVVDGALARRFELTTRFGATLDAVADKLAQVTLFGWLALRAASAFEPIPLWFLGVLVSRDVAMAIGYAVIKARVGVVATEHALHGKLASLLMFALLIWVLWGGGLRALPWAFAISAAVIVGSTALYVRAGFAQLRGGDGGDLEPGEDR